MESSDPEQVEPPSSSSGPEDLEVKELPESGPIQRLGTEQLLSIFAFLSPHEFSRSALVCKEWSHLPQDEKLWKDVCLQVWSERTVERRLERQLSPRDLWLAGSLPRLDGAYILTTSRWHYSGLDNAISLYPTPVGPVEIASHRYLRFFPNGEVLYALSNLRPKVSEPRWGPLGVGSNKALHWGSYRIAKDRIQVKVNCGHIISLFQLQPSQSQAGAHDFLSLETFHGRYPESQEVIRFSVPLESFCFEVESQKQHFEQESHDQREQRALRQRFERMRF